MIRNAFRPASGATDQIPASNQSDTRQRTCARRRGDQIEMLFAAVRESLVGTFETCRPALWMSVSGGRPEVNGRNDA